MKIEYLKYKNFFSVGKEPVEINFQQYGNMVLIQGINNDFHEEDKEIIDEKHTNNAGKSSIAESISYGFYGNFIRDKANHTNAINHKTKKKLEVEIIFKLHKNYYKIIRTRKPNTLRLWESPDKEWSQENELTLGGIPATQKLIDEILGLNHKAFINISYFGQNNKQAFLDCDAKSKREIAESLLSLDTFKYCGEYTKEQTKELKRDVKELVYSYEKLKNDELTYSKRLSQFEIEQQNWKDACLGKISECNFKIKNFTKELDYDNIVEIENAHEEIEELENKILKYNEKKQQLQKTLQDANDKIHKIKIKITDKEIIVSKFKSQNIELIENISKLNNEITDIKNLKEGIQCDVCYGTVNPKNYKPVLEYKQNSINKFSDSIDINKDEIKANEAEKEKLEKDYEKIKNFISSANSNLRTIDSFIIKSQRKITNLNEVENKSSSKDIVIKEKINQCKNIILEKEKEIETGSPYLKIIESAKKELSDKTRECIDCKNKIKDKENLIPYYEYWVKGFTDGIRSFVIQRILPSLNNKLNYWMQILLNGKISLKFDNQLEPEIEKNPPDGNKFLYHMMGGGLKKRIDLAILQAFAHVMMTSSGTTPSLLFLDEIGTDFDKLGKQQLYKMICELASHRQVFIITHDVTILEMLDGIEKLTLELKDGITRRV